MQLTIDALKDAAAWPGPDQRTLVVLASQPMAAEPHWEGHPPAELYAGRGPGQRKGNAMNTRSSYPGVESRISPRPGSSLSEVQRSRSWVPPTTVAPAR
jgi:hypothetical protein